MFLQTIKNPEVFHTSIPSIPMGKYAHVVILRETNSFPLFQTDQELNFARVSPGRVENGKIPAKNSVSTALIASTMVLPLDRKEVNARKCWSILPFHSPITMSRTKL